MNKIIKEYKHIKNSGCKEVEISYADYANKYDDCDKKPDSYNAKKKTIVVYMPNNYRIPDTENKIDETDPWRIHDMVKAMNHCSTREAANLLQGAKVYKDWDIMEYIKIIEDDSEKEKLYEMIKTQQPMENWQIYAERNTSYYIGYDALEKVDKYYERKNYKQVREWRKKRHMENRKICRMIEILEERSDKYKNDIMEILKTEEDFDLAVKVFEVSNRTKSPDTSSYYDRDLEQARYTTAECLNVLFENEKVNFWDGDISLYHKLEMFVVNKEHIHFLKGYKEDDSAILFNEDVDFSPSVSGELTWLAEIDDGKIEYTLFEDQYKQALCVSIDDKPNEKTMEKVEQWYYDHGFEFEKRQKEVENND